MTLGKIYKIIPILNIGKGQHIPKHPLLCWKQESLPDGDTLNSFFIITDLVHKNDWRYNPNNCVKIEHSAFWHSKSSLCDCARSFEIKQSDLDNEVQFMNAYNMDGKAPQITRILFDNILKCRAQVESKLEHINIFCDYANNEGIVKDIGSNFINNYHGELVTVVDELQQVKSIIDDKKEKAKSKEKSK